MTKKKPQQMEDEASTNESEPQREEPQLGCPEGEEGNLIRQAAYEAFQEGSLKSDQYVRIWLASRSPQVQAASMAFLDEQVARDDTPADGYGALDWLKIIQKIKTLLPLILQIIDAFSKDTEVKPIDPNVWTGEV